MPFIVKYPVGRSTFNGESKLRSNHEIATDIAKGLQEGHTIILPDCAEALGWKIEWIGPQIFFTDGDGI